MGKQDPRRNFASPAPVDVGLPRQIAYYSYFPGETIKYEYQSHEALKSYSPPDFEKKRSLRLLPKVIKRKKWRKTCDYLDSLPQPGVEPIVAACQQAGCADDLLKADVITTKGTLVDLALGEKQEYEVSFVDGKLHVLLESFKSRTKIKSNGPYYGDCFKKLCTSPTTKKSHGTFFSVVSRKVGNLNVLISGEVDCSSSNNSKPKIEDYIQLKTLQKGDWLHRHWYLQSYMLGIQVLQIGYRNPKGCVSINQKPVEELLRGAEEYDPSFDPAVDMGRAHDILDALLEHFRSLGPSISAEDRFVLRVGRKSRAWVTSPSKSCGLRTVRLHNRRVRQ